MKTDFTGTWAWMSSATFLAASAHVGWALAVVTLAIPHLGLWWSAGLFLGLWSFPKEFGFDLLLIQVGPFQVGAFQIPAFQIGEGDTLADSIGDFAGYVGGVVLALLFHWIF